MPELKMELPQVPDTPWQDSQFTFDGQWIPDLDPALIGPENFATLQNLRYKDKGLEGVSGYTKVNSSTALSTYTKIRNGIQLRTPHTVASYNIVHAVDGSDQGVIYQNQTNIGSDGDFNGSSLHTDTSTGLIGRFSLAPQGNMVYCNGEENRIWAGNEITLAAAFETHSDSGSVGINDVTEDLNSSLETSFTTLGQNFVPDGDMEDDPANNWTSVNGATLAEETTVVNGGSKSLSIGTNAADEGAKSGTFDTTSGQVYDVVVHVYPDDTTNVTVMVIDGDGSTSLHDTSHTGLTQDAWNEIYFQVTSSNTGSGAYIQVDSGAETGTNTYYVDNVIVIEEGYTSHLQLFTTRPAKGFKFYVKTANGTTSTLTVDYWDGDSLEAVSNGSDGTASGGVSLAQTGTYSFDDTDGSVKPRHFEGLFLYAYDVHLSAGSAEIYHVTADCDFQSIKDVWDGVYRQPIQFQVFDSDHYEDFTLHVNQSSDVNTPVGGQLDGLTSSDHVIVVFEGQQTAMRWVILGDLHNTNASVMDVEYWNGLAWNSVSNLDDGTVSDDSTKTLNRSGLITWTSSTDESKQTLFGSYGYAYRISFDSTLSGTKGGTEASVEILVDLCYGIPAQLTVDPFDFSVLYKNRLMLGGFSSGKQGNRMDFCASNAPDVWNGTDSSDDGNQSLYFGNEEGITCATQLYNRFGSNIFSMLLVFKDGETYVMTGDTPSDFQIFPVSLTTGCPAPLTLATAEVGFEAGAGVQRQVAMWVSHAGPMMFDGAVLQPIRGIDLYFDPSEDEFVDWDNMDKARGWVDPVFKEYNLLLPSGSTQTTNNKWLVYDLIRKKWFQKDTGTENVPQAAWPVLAAGGDRGVYGGIDTGYMIEIEEGTSWNCTYASPSGGSDIDQKVRTGDFFPSNNIWDEILIRKFKIISEKISSTNTVTLTINQYRDSARSASSVIFQDSDSSSGIAVDFEDMDVDGDGTDEVSWVSSSEGAVTLSVDVGTDRLVRLIQDMNRRGWSHSFEFVISTSAVNKGWKPIAWGIRYRVDRKDDTSTE